MTRIIMHGCNGRMGQVISEICMQDEQTQIVGGIDVSDHLTNPYPVFLSPDQCNVEADVIIDFSNALGVDAIIEFSKTRQIPIVLCTTGLSEEQLQKVIAATKVTAVLKSANMSLGINTLMNLLKTAVKTLAPAGFDVEIVEKHHNQKLDAPSGTALALADAMNEEMDHSFSYVYDRSQVRKKREKQEMGISAIRGGTIVGEHDVIFAGTDEVITISHTAYSRAVFAKGAVEAAKFLAHKPAGLYDMQDVIA